MSAVAGVDPVVMASQTLESGPFYRDEMPKLLNKSEYSPCIQTKLFFPA